MYLKHLLNRQITTLLPGPYFSIARENSQKLDIILIYNVNSGKLFGMVFRFHIQPISRILDPYEKRRAY